MNLIAKYIGGSHLYKLSTPESDVDWRGVFLTDNISEILGWTRDQVVHDTREFGDDVLLFELKRFLQLLKKTNTNVVEALYVPFHHFEILTDLFKKVIQARYNLLDSDRLYRSTCGYVKSEGRLALGERTGKLGGKRKAMLDKYGFSPKNVTQIIRIVVAADWFLQTGHYPLDISGVDKKAYNLAFKIKTNPRLFSFEDVSNIIREYDEKAKEMKDLVKLTFKDDVALDIILHAYRDQLEVRTWLEF
jgi:predicted nucleotidyltransferase